MNEWMSFCLLSVLSCDFLFYLDSLCLSFHTSCQVSRLCDYALLFFTCGLLSPHPRVGLYSLYSLCFALFCASWFCLARTQNRCQPMVLVMPEVVSSFGALHCRSFYSHWCFLKLFFSTLITVEFPSNYWFVLYFVWCYSLKSVFLFEALSNKIGTIEVFFLSHAFGFKSTLKLWQELS